MNDRIRKLRKYLGLTQKDFGNRIGVKGNTIATYESGRNEPIDSVISLICREFNVNEKWLRTGEGEMFRPAPTDALDALAAEQKLSHGEYILIEKLLSLKPEVRQGILDYILEVAAAINETGSAASDPGYPNMSLSELHAELDRQFDDEKTTKEKSEVS